MKKKLLSFFMICILVMNMASLAYAEDISPTEDTKMQIGDGISETEMFSEEDLPAEVDVEDKLNMDAGNGAEIAGEDNTSLLNEEEAQDTASNVSEDEEVPQDSPDQVLDSENMTNAMEQLGTSRTQSDAIAWVKSQVGKQIDTDGYPKEQPYQCVDLIKAYYSYLGVAPVSGNGADYTSNTLPSGWSRIPGAAPQPGDILVYTKGYGHVAIFESTYSTYHQNFSNNPFVQKLTFAYNGFSNPYWGVIRPNWNSAPVSLSFGNDDCQWDTTNAFIYTKATVGSSGIFTEAGMTVWNASGNTVASKAESINTRGSFLEIWYNIANDTGVRLISGQRYSYQFYTVFNGTRYYSPIKSFITNSIVPGQVTNVKASGIGVNTAKITWDKVASADGYLIYASKNGKYAYCGKTQNSSFVDQNALSSAYNFYWVYAYVQNADGKMTTGSCQKYAYARAKLPAVSGLRAASVKGGVRLTWGKVLGAEGYLVYGKKANGTYGYKGIVTSGTAFTDKKASKAVYNFYWVFPYYKISSGKRIIGGTPKYVYGKAK